MESGGIFNNINSPGTPIQRETEETRFFQGAFGFAPRIVILEDGEEVFDRVA